MEEQFDFFLEKSDALRGGYRASLLPANRNGISTISSVVGEVPELLRIIYSEVSGTAYEVENQMYMDFLPGYLLIHIDEYADSYKQLRNLLSGLGVNGDYFPLLRNYSSDFVAIKKDSDEIYKILHDETEPLLMHKTPDDFLTTINAFYTEGVFYTDDDNYLDYDEDLQYEVARRYNPGVEFWIEE